MSKMVRAYIIKRISEKTTTHLWNNTTEDARWLPRYNIRDGIMLAVIEVVSKLTWLEIRKTLKW